MAQKILVADDQTDVLQLIAVRLKSNGFDVVTAGDGQEALLKVKEEQPNLVVLDLMMPKLDGYKACRLLKFDSRYKKIPVMILSARSQNEDIKLAEKCGADAYMVKPFDPPAFIGKIKELLAAAEAAGEKKSP